MRTNLTIIMLIALTGLSGAGVLDSYPPENAAVLYYKCAIQYMPSDELKSKISDAATGVIEIDEELAKEINGYEHVIKELVDAGGIAKCDWGIDYSQGIATLLSGLSDIKNLSKLLIADARLLCSEGKYAEAINLCVAAERLASHVSDMTLISGLVGTSISAMGDKCVTHILGEMPHEAKQLLRVKTILGNFENRVDRIKVGLDGEKLLAMVHFDPRSEMRMTPKMLKEFGWKPETDAEKKLNKILIDKLSRADDVFFNELTDYWFKMIDNFIACYDLPYAEAYGRMNVEIPEMIFNDSQKKPEATLARPFMPALGKIYSLSIKSQNSLNAIKAAVEVYLVKAKTGKLPGKLPAGCAKDLFSGKDFIYEKTADCFVIRCKGKELGDDKVHEYEFKVKK